MPITSPARGVQDHRCVYTSAALDRRHTGPIPQVERDQVEIGKGSFKEGGGLFRHEGMGGPVKPVAPDLVCLVEFERNGIEIRLDWKALVKGGVENTRLDSIKGKILRATWIPIRLAGLCSGARGMHASMSAMTRSSIRVVASKESPPWTTRWPMAVISDQLPRMTPVWGSIKRSTIRCKP